MLLADVMGLGKTASAISMFCEPHTRPAVVVVPTTLCTQWQREFEKFLPGVTTHIISGRKPYTPPVVDIYIITYSRIAAWGHFLFDKSGPIKYKTLVLDEVQELRRTDTAKRDACRALSEV